MRFVLRVDEADSAQRLDDLVGRAVNVSVGGGDVTVKVTEVINSTVMLEAPDVSPATRSHLDSGDAIHLSWGDHGGLATIDARVEHWRTEESLQVRCGWPPSHLERRAFRRLTLEADIWLVPLHLDTHPIPTEVGDISGSGLTASDDDHRVDEGDLLGITLPVPTGTLLAVGSVVGRRRRGRDAAVRFDHLSQGDENGLVRLINQAELRRR